jgi:hypothetical protein
MLPWPFGPRSSSHGRIPGLTQPQKGLALPFPLAPPRSITNCLPDICVAPKSRPDMEKARVMFGLRVRLIATNLARFRQHRHDSAATHDLVLEINNLHVSVLVPCCRTRQIFFIDTRGGVPTVVSPSGVELDSIDAVQVFLVVVTSVAIACNAPVAANVIVEAVVLVVGRECVAVEGEVLLVEEGEAVSDTKVVVGVSLQRG